MYYVLCYLCIMLCMYYADYFLSVCRVFRYRKLSAKVHPDKLIGIEAAREAFEQVKSAYQRLMDVDQRVTLIRNIEFVTDDIKKDRKKQVAKGLLDESSLPPLETAIEKAVMKLFADIEQQRRRSET